MHVIDKPPRARIIRMRNVPAIDATGIHVLQEESRSSRRRGIAYIIAGIQPQPRAALEKVGLLELIGRENLLEDIDDALTRAKELLARETSAS